MKSAGAATKRAAERYLIKKEIITAGLRHSRPDGVREQGTEPWQKTKIAAEELAEMIRDGLAEEGHDVQVRPNPETGWDVAVISANEAQDAGIRAEVIAAGLRRRYNLEK